MDATQMMCDSILESDEDENEEENENERGRPLAKLCILKNQHIPETELPLFLGDNVLGRDPNTCTLPLPASSISKQHATICISAYKRRGSHSEVDIEALVWDLGSMNGTRKGRLKLTPNVRYALSERDSLVVADIPCQYVSCAVDAVSAQGDVTSPVSKKSGVNARLPDASGEKGGDTSTDGKKCVNGGSKARVSLPDQGDTRKTPVRSSCLSFEQTPTQPQGSLVPESDSDSDGERGDRLRKALVSDSDSRKSGPDCSTFLSPRNTIVPESEDESPITPSSSTKNRPHRHVSFSKEETDEDVGRQQLKKKEAVAIVDDSEVEEGMEEERAALGGIKSGESGQHVSAQQKSNVSLTGEDKLPVSTPADAIPAFNMDSDTDVEGEEEGVASAGPVTLNTNQQSDHPPNTAQFHMDSDTDVDEDDDAFDKVPKSVPSSADHTKPPDVISVIQPEGITMDSDTDVDDDDAAAVSDATTEAKPTSLQSPHKADSAPSTQLKDFHLDSDTDVDEEEEKEHGTNNACPKIDETPARLDNKPVGPVSVPAAPSGLHLDSDTDDEAIPVPASSEPSVASAVTDSRQTADAEPGLDILSDSDTDVEANSPLVVPLTISTLSGARQSGSDADTDVDESSVPPAGDGVSRSKPKADSGTDVEDEEVDFGETGEGQIPNLCRENTPGLLAPLLQNCSTPVQASEGDVEDMQTQAFVSPSSGPFKSPPALRPTALSSCSDSQEGEDFVVAETQSFILQTRDRPGNPSEDHTMDPTQEFGLESSGDERGEQSSRGLSFQLGLSDSSHLQGQAQTLSTESTQAFVPAEGGVNMEETQAYAAISNADRTSLESEATQAYGDDEEPARSSVVSANLALEATQPYISEPRSDSENETDEDERNNTATVETQQFPTSSTLAMAQTQPMCAFEEEEEDLEEENPISSVLQVKPRRQNEKEERDEHEKAAQSQKSLLPVAATQPMPVSDNEESDDEDSIPGPRRRKAKPLQLEEEQSQTLPNSALSLVETQPMHVGVAQTQPMATSGNEESDDEDSIPGPRKRKAKQLQIEDEQTQTLTNSELSVVATQPMEMDEDGESDEEDLIPGPRRRRAKPLQLEETQPLTSPEVTAAETQPVVKGEDRESDEEDLIPSPRRRRAKALQLEETQPLTSPEVTVAETQPAVKGKDRESDDEDSIPGPRKRKAKVLQIQEEETQPLTNPEASTVETQPLETKTGRQPQRRKGRQSEAGTSGTTASGKRGTRAALREEEEQVECSEPPKRQTRGKNKALPTTRGRRGKSRPDEEESEEEEEVEPPKRARGKISMRQQKVNKEEEERPETARNKRTANNDLIKEQDGRRERDKLERERKEKEEQERLQAENAERSRLERERAEKARLESERKEEEEKKRAERVQKEKEEQLERERKEKEEKDRLEREKAEREEKERLEREEKERIEKERKEKEEKERLEREEKERIERERKEKEEKERLKREKAEREEKERLEREEKERIEKERKEKEEKERLEREEKERIERERKEKEEKERLEREEKERIEKERKEKEEKERLEREQKERIERERKEQEEKERLKREKAEREEKKRLEREEKERIEKERKEKEEKERLEREKAEREEKERLEREQKERFEKERKEQEEKERLETAKQEKEQQKNKEEEKKAKTSARSGRATRRTIAAPSTTEPEQDSTVSANDDGPARRTRSRSNSSNSVSSERSTSSVSTQGNRGRGRGRGRGGKRTSEPPQTAVARSSNRRRTVAAESTEQDSKDISPQGVLSRSSSINSLNSEISSCSTSSQRGGRGGRQRGRGRKTEPEPVSIPPSHSDQNLASKPTARGRKSRKAEEASNEVPHDDDKEKADSQQPSTTRGRWRANANDAEPAADKKDPANQECASEESTLPKKSVKGRGQEVVKSETVEAPVASAASDRDEAREKRKGRKRELEEEPSSCSNISKGKEKAETTEAAKDDIPVQAKRKGRASMAQAKMNTQDSPTEVKVKEDSEKMEEETVEKRGRGRTSAAQKKKKDEQEGSGASVDQDPHVEASEPKTPTSSASRKRQAPANTSPVAKTPRSSSASPAAGGRLQVASQAYKVLFTGVVDEDGERVLARLRGSIAKGVADMNCLVTDKVRRTVKFLCAVAKGIPIVTTQWLAKSGKVGSFLPPDGFLVKDPEQEKKFNFCLQESLGTAGRQPLLQGYEIHVTKSVKPEPVQMKDIISCSGATFLPKMPSSHKPQTVVISCEEDWSLCGPALSASLPVVTAEFILTGILQQKVDLQTHTLSAPTNAQQPAGGKGRSRKKT